MTAMNPSSLPPDSGLTASDDPSIEPSALAGCLSGLIVGAAGGTALGLMSAGGVLNEKVGFGAALGAVLGAIILRKIAECRTVIGGAVFGMFVPVALVLMHAVRSGRIGEIGTGMNDPMFLKAAAIGLGGGALIGGLLVAVRKGIERITG
jgi:hypothetical protein